jgi:hypothetical protein
MTFFQFSFNLVAAGQPKKVPALSVGELTGTRYQFVLTQTRSGNNWYPDANSSEGYAFEKLCQCADSICVLMSSSLSSDL